MRPASVSPNAPGVLLLYTASVFTSALLLFLVEPMVAKSLLPLVGGAPAVWTTSLLFFQAMLLAGYGYSHLVATRLGPRLQALLQTGVLHLAVLSLPIQFAGVGSPAPGSNPLGWQLAVMLTRVGRLRPGGLLLFNISNSYVDFSAVLGATGRSLGLRAYERVDGNLTARDQARGKLASDWLVLARSESDAASAQSWSDVYSDILSVMRRFLRSWALRGR